MKHVRGGDFARHTSSQALVACGITVLWIFNALKNIAKLLHRNSPSVDRGAQLDRFTSSWVAAKS